MSARRILQWRGCWLVADYRRPCPSCGKWPIGISARSKKKARRALERMRECPCKGMR